jgi:hypothetical protein
LEVDRKEPYHILGVFFNDILCNHFHPHHMTLFL